MNYEINAYWSASGLYRIILDFNDGRRGMLSELGDGTFVVQNYETEGILEQASQAKTFNSFHSAFTYLTVSFADSLLNKKVLYNS